VVNPAEGAFSILAWVKGGTPGQVLISQAGGMNWLRAAPTDGCLMTEAKGAGRTSSTLCSQAIITDGKWHRVGLVYDGATRSLYVDDVLAAKDTQSLPASCSGGLNLGCGASPTPGTLWSGLIDDVRIYSRAVRP
ncbi:MAG: LamG domain-containing protein, partial [Sedimentisphaerales bacterium]|nr:LamG domain-containing protein [Sedimentisphaerales bacterium]